MRKATNLSDGEFKVMSAIWASEVPMTQALVMKTINSTLEKKLNVSTYATYLRRIMTKGYLEKRYHGDGHPTYHPTMSRDEYFEQSLRDFCSKWSQDRLFELTLRKLRELPEEQVQEFINSLSK